jgi:hypothetical protein
MRMKLRGSAILISLIFPFFGRAATPFVANLKGLQVVALEVNGDASPAKKAGYPLEQIRKDLKSKLEQAGLKVVKSQGEVPEGKKAMPAELLLGMVNRKDLYSYALSFNVYEPMRVDGKDHLYVAWTSMLYGFGTQQSIKSQIKDQAQMLIESFTSDYKAAKRR